MQGVARNFFILGIVMAIVGMMLGLKMAKLITMFKCRFIHIMVAAWLMSAVFGFFYHLFPAAGKTNSPPFISGSAVSIVVLVVSLFRSGDREWSR
jgi:hypothetical protein